MAKGIKKAVYRVRNAVIAEIRSNAQGGLMSSAIAGEGYAGGYLQAINDVIAALNDTPVSNSRYEYQWQKVKTKKS